MDRLLSLIRKFVYPLLHLLRWRRSKKHTATETSDSRRGTRTECSDNCCHEVFQTSLTDLPAELLIHITSFLPQEAIALLGVTSKHLRSVILSSHISLSLDDPATKRNFILLLTKDTPDYLACRSGDHMFKWRESLWHVCPCRVGRPSHLHRWVYTCNCHHFGSHLYPETVDLLLRHHEQGLQYGLNMLAFEHDCEHAPFWSGEERPVGRTSWRGRIVDGQVLIVAKHTINLDLSKMPSPYRWPPMNLPCRHVNCDLQKEIAAKLRKLANSDRFRHDMGLRGCPKCTTDYRVKLFRESAGEIVTLEVSSWRNFGGRCPKDPYVANMFWPPYEDRSIDQKAFLPEIGPVAGRSLELYSAIHDPDGETNE